MAVDFHLSRHVLSVVFLIKFPLFQIVFRKVPRSLAVCPCGLAGGREIIDERPAGLQLLSVFRQTKSSAYGTEGKRQSLPSTEHHRVDPLGIISLPEFTDCRYFENGIMGVLSNRWVVKRRNDMFWKLFALFKVYTNGLAEILRVREKKDFERVRLDVAVKSAFLQRHLAEGFNIDAEVSHGLERWIILGDFTG